MKILITGLCLQGNKGGPALALSLKKQLCKYVDDVTFIFSVPQGEEFKYEIPWSKTYGVNIVQNYSYSDFFPPFIVRNYSVRYKRVKQWFSVLSSVDVVVDMSAISYVGPPINQQIDTVLGARFRYFMSAFLFRKPFLAWTISYGPFSTKIIRFLAKLDLNRQPIIFCRGEDCRSAVKKILPDKKVLSFPDVATVLNFDQEWGKQYIRSIEEGIGFERLVTISVSAVMYTRSKGRDIENKHVDDMCKLCLYLNEKGYFVLLVPHTYRPNRLDPKRCDFAVSKLVINKLNNVSNVALTEEDLSPIHLKSIISSSFIHIGARYHSIVAALSSGIPCISMSWHPKYKDIMRQYGVDEYVYYGLNDSPIEDLFLIFEKVCKYRAELNSKLLLAQKKVASQVEKNTELFVALIRSSVK